MTADTRASPVKAEGRRPNARALWPWLAFWIIVSAVVWNGVFEILITRGVKEYLYRQADHELGRGPVASMREIMDQTAADAAVTASLWALFVGAAGLVTVYAVRRVEEPVHASTDI